MASQWYGDGLKFRCTQCGNCCTGAPGYVWVTRQEIAKLVKFLGLSQKEFGLRYLRRIGNRNSLIEKPNGDCVFYDRGCSVYPARPRQCRTYPFWPENLRSKAAWEGVSEECPGVGTGKLYSPDDIRVIRRGHGSAAKDG